NLDSRPEKLKRLDLDAVADERDCEQHDSQGQHEQTAGAVVDREQSNCTANCSNTTNYCRNRLDPSAQLERRSASRPSQPCLRQATKAGEAAIVAAAHLVSIDVTAGPRLLPRVTGATLTAGGSCLTDDPRYVK